VLLVQPDSVSGSSEHDRISPWLNSQLHLNPNATLEAPIRLIDPTNNYKIESKLCDPSDFLMKTPQPTTVWSLYHLRTVILCLLAAAIVWFPSDVAYALIPVRLFDLSYDVCPDELGRGVVDAGSSNAANCFIIHGKTENTSGKPVVNADIFGRIYDATHNTVFPNRNRIGAIDEIAPGVGEFSFQITVSANLPEPLQFEGFKASGFQGQVRR
jgi:hypothetical protein